MANRHGNPRDPISFPDGVEDVLEAVEAIVHSTTPRDCPRSTRMILPAGAIKKSPSSVVEALAL
jgi:hypothetical protein